MIRELRFKEILKVPSGSRVFIGSVTDIFHPWFMMDRENSIDVLFDFIQKRPDVTFQVLTKRPWNAESYFRERNVPDNVWMGTTVESQRWLVRIDFLSRIDAKTRFLSCEPLLEDLVAGGSMLKHPMNRIHWIIAGAESGKGRRPYDEQWAKSLRDLCSDMGIAFFYKQGQDFKPGKHAVLDGMEWHEFPVRNGLVC
jgi:protein gp37